MAAAGTPRRSRANRAGLDGVIAGLLFMAGDAAEVSALRRRRQRDRRRRGAGHQRRGKTSPKGKTRDVRFVKGRVARAIQTLRATASPAPRDRVAGLSSKAVGLLFQAAARADVEHVTTGSWHTTRPGATAERAAVVRYL